jgi:PAS domain S-box-containing protein
MPKPSHPPTCADSEDRFRLILHNVRDFAIFAADLEGRINEWNPGAERFFGYTDREILGQPMDMLYVPEDREAGRAELEKAQAARTGFSEDERWHLKKDGSRFFVNGVVNAMYDDEGKLCGYIKIARDVTQRKVLEERLVASEEQHRLILEAIKDFAIIGLDLQGNIQKWNPGAALTFGYSEEEMLGKEHALLFPAADQAGGEPARQLAKALREGVSQSERWLVRKDGEQVFVIDVLRPMADEGGRIYGVLRVARDITKRHITNLKLQATQRELENIQAELEEKVAHRTAAQEQTVQSLEQVLYHVAHDLRGPLRVMEGFSSILVEKYASSRGEEANRLTGFISASARRMDQLIQDLLIYGRLCHEPVRRERVSVSKVVAAALDNLEEEIRAAGAEIKVKEMPQAVRGDERVLVQVIEQLAINALNFAAPARKSSVRIWAEAVSDQSVRLWVEDNGVGIAKEYQDRIFWLFERLSQEDTGSTGMGLAIVQKGVERMGGKMGVQSTPGVGSKFWMELPAATEERNE